LTTHLSGGALGNDVNLKNANLFSADLTGANLNDAELTGANLSEAVLTKADLSVASLDDADLSSALGITNEELEQQALTLDGATMPNGQKYEDWLKDKESRKEK
jgi:uncharacterized protein YjbI with pentapeptide repeats